MDKMAEMAEMVRRYYVDGFGMPRKYYTKKQVEDFADKKLITQTEKKQILKEKEKAASI